MGKHPKIQNHREILFHTRYHFVLCPPTGLDYWVEMKAGPYVTKDIQDFIFNLF